MSKNRNVPWYVADNEKPMWKDRLIISHAALCLVFLSSLVAWLAGNRDLGLGLLILGLVVGQEVSNWQGKRDGWRRGRGDIA